MSFVTKEWKDRIVEFAGRRKLTNVADSSVAIYDVERNEGTVSQAGDAFSAANMNDLEDRISTEFTAINENLNGITDNGNITNVRINPNDSNALQWSSDGGSEWHDFFKLDFTRCYHGEVVADSSWTQQTLTFANPIKILIWHNGSSAGGPTMVWTASEPTVYHYNDRGQFGVQNVGSEYVSGISCGLVSITSDRKSANIYKYSKNGDYMAFY